MKTTLGEQLPQETRRVRELIRSYQETQALCGPKVMCGPAIYLMEQALQRADQAMITADVVTMIKSFQELQGFE